MHRIIAAIIMIVLIISAIIGGNLVIANSYETLNTDIEKIIERIMEEKYPEALMSAESFSQKWEREKKALAVFSNHGPIDDITLNIGELFAGIKTGNQSLSLSKIFEIERLLRLLNHEQILTIESFF